MAWPRAIGCGQVRCAIMLAVTYRLAAERALIDLAFACS